MRNIILFIALLDCLISMAATVSIKDPNADYQMQVNSNGSINVTSDGSGSFTVIQGTTPWVDNITQFGSHNVVTGTGSSGLGIPRFTISNDSNILATQSGAWTTGRTWTLLNTTDSVNAVQSGTWTTGRTWNLLNSTDSVNSVQSGTWTVQPGNTANTTPWLMTINQNGNSAIVTPSNALKVDGSAVTQPVSQVTSPWVTNVAQFNGSDVVTGIGSSGSGIPRVTVSNDSNVLATQSGTWTVQQGSAPWSVSQSGSWTVQQGTPPWSVSQSGTWTTGRTWTLGLATDSITVYQGTSPWVDNISQFGGSNVVTGVGNSGAGIPRVTVSSDSNLTNITGTISLPTGASTSANQTNGSQKTQVVDGSGTVQGPLQTISGTNYAPVVLAASATPGAAVVARSIQVAGSDGTNAQTISTDATGKLNINNISGTVSLPTGASTSSNQTNGNQKTQQVDGSGNVQPAGDVASRKVFTALTDGTNTTAVKAGSTAALASDPSAVVALSPNSPVPSGSNVIGALTANQSVNVSQFAGNNTVTGTGASGSGIPRVTVSNDSNVLATQSGTWTVQQGSPPWTITGTGSAGTPATGVITVQGISGGTNQPVSQATASSLNAQVVGNVASGSSDSGNPIKISGIFHSTTPSFSDGQRADFQQNIHGLGLTDSTSTDVSGTFTTTSNTSAIDASGYGSVAFTVDVSAASGTTPTLDIQFQESEDGSTDWVDMYDADRFTTTGSYKTVRHAIHSRYYRYRYVIGGTTPSFTFTIKTTLKPFTAETIHVFNRFNDLVMTTSNNFSSTINIEGCSFFTATLTRGSGGAGVTIVPQFSNDATNWISSGTSINTSASTSYIATNTAGSTTKYVRFTNTNNQAAATTLDIKYYCKE